MPGTLVPPQMFDHTLDPIKGWGTDMHVVDKRGQLDPEETVGAKAGMCVHLDPTTGLLQKGIVAGAMALFIWNNKDDFDVNGDVGSIQSNIVNTLVAIGAYELQTTEFVEGEDYVPNTPLTSAPGDGADSGKLVPGVIGTDDIVGIVSDNSNNGSLPGNTATTLPFTNEFGKDVINFWPVFCPAQ